MQRMIELLREDAMCPALEILSHEALGQGSRLVLQKKGNMDVAFNTQAATKFCQIRDIYEDPNEWQFWLQTGYDTRIRDSFSIATERGLAYSFTPCETETDVHPNTVDIRMENAAGQVMTVRGESLGGGKVRIVRINGVAVDFTGEYNALIVVQQDKPGVVAHITKILSDRGVNIAFMRLFREEKGHTAYTIVESDERLPEGVDKLLLENPNINDVMVVQQ